MRKTSLLISLILLTNLVFSQDLLRYIDGESTVVQADWRLKQPKVNEAGYDYFSKTDDGTPLKPIISNDSYVGSHSIAYEVNSSSIKERFEHKFYNIDDADAVTFENERYFGFVFKMDGAKFDDLTSSLIFWQAWQGPPYGPPINLKFMTQKKGSEYRVKLAIRNDDTGALGGTETDAGSVYLAKDIWHTVQIYLKARYLDGTSQLTVWIDGTETMSYSGKIGYTPDPPTDDLDTDFKYNGLVCKWGIYQPDANTGHRLLFDEIKYGNTYNTVLPTIKTSIKENYFVDFKIQNKILILSKVATLVELYEMNGILIIKKEKVNSVNLNMLKTGVYILMVDGISRKILL